MSQPFAAFDPSPLGLSIFDDIDDLNMALHMKLDRLTPEELYPPRTTDLCRVLSKLGVKPEAVLTYEKLHTELQQRFGGGGLFSLGTEEVLDDLFIAELERWDEAKRRESTHLEPEIELQSLRLGSTAAPLKRVRYSTLPVFFHREDRFEDFHTAKNVTLFHGCGCTATEYSPGIE